MLSTRAKIKISNSVEEIEALVQQSKTYEFARSSTLRRIKEAAENRITFLLRREEKSKASK